MAVLQMQRITICGLQEDKKSITGFIQRHGVIEFNDLLQQDEVFQKMDFSSSEAVFSKNSVKADSALETLEAYDSEKKSLLSMFEGRKQITLNEYDAFSEKETEISEVVAEIISLEKEIAESKAEILKFKLQTETLIPWSSLDVPLSFQGTAYTTAFIGTLPNTWTLEMVYEQLAEYTPVNVDIINASREQTCIMAICEKGKADLVSDKLKSNGFAYPVVSGDIAPIKQIQQFEEQIKEYESLISADIEKIKGLAKKREDIKLFADSQSIGAGRYNAASQMLQSKNVFFISGFIPQKAVNFVTDYMKNYSAEVVVEEPTEDDDVPIALQNKGFAAPLEGVVEAFSLPGRREIDPSMVVAVFYYLFFGAMLSETMYGVALVLGCGFILHKFKHTIEGPMKKNMQMFMYCGFGTILWGVIYGSYFGDAISVISTTFFGKTVAIPPLWLDPVKNPMTVLVLSLALGIIHIFVGLGANLYQCIKRKDIKSALYDVILWYMILVGCLLMGLSSQMIIGMTGLSWILPASVGKVGMILAAVAAIGIILTNGRESKSPVKRILKGLYALYNITGYLSDMLSYSRLLALGLATGVICSVVNKIGAMFGPTPLGVIIFIVIFIGGNALNIGINALGAYVHSNRLAYVELFGKFYEGGGRKFEPYIAKTKYYKIKEN
ncbi:V-type ATP synthase subunit I [Parasporobacterium paucivorans]|uniref:V/A-type H+-transporting ATPase subunit I n=1 Tax=Parasporobacterium paucivorans DSM 15970 TaxID=1122934 RepID=A0A1M6CQR5_9FIRM|nr:V-type ATP synthase subunit I [Parasporobacterium paucivorans]SHI63078.1 V/A-type H+-transporting ATPase subunit I [Parasporobacterium paucivorans DSM 15970]